MRALDRRLATALVLAGALACGEKASAPSPAPSAPQAAPAPPATPAPPAPPPDPAAAVTGADRTTVSAAPASPARPAPAPAPAMKPVPAPAPPAPAAGPAPAPAAKPAPEPPPSAGAHAKVGPDKCRMCHRVQHLSWAESAHAKKGLDCEGCHGNGGDYWPAAVMRDRARAAAAGLVQPGVERCRRCHPKADASLLPRAHAHRAP